MCTHTVLISCHICTSLPLLAAYSEGQHGHRMPAVVRPRQVPQAHPAHLAHPAHPQMQQGLDPCMAIAVDSSGAGCLGLNFLSM